MDFDRTAEDVGNIVALEHVNLQVPDQQIATAFYVVALGLTRDPYLMTGLGNMWINVGRSQFHLPTGEAQVLRGCVGLVIADYDALPARLESAEGLLHDTRYTYAINNDHIDVTCPWGNRFRCHPPGPSFGPMTLGMPYIRFEVARGTADAISRFYRDVLGAPARCAPEGDLCVARVQAGIDQKLVFRESSTAEPDYDGHHIQVYVADFSGPHHRLLKRGLITEESDQHQYRFEDIVDPASGARVFAIEHEVRSMRHPLYARPLVNRDPAQSNVGYRAGRDALPLG